MVEQREDEDTVKRDALREAARVGFDAIERGAYRQFDSVCDLTDYLRRLSDDIIDAAAH